MKTKKNLSNTNLSIILIGLFILLISISFSYFYPIKHQQKLSYQWGFLNTCYLFDSASSIVMLSSFRENFNKKNKVNFKWTYRNLDNNKLIIHFYTREDLDSPIVKTFEEEFDIFTKIIQTKVKDNDQYCNFISLPLNVYETLID